MRKPPAGAVDPTARQPPQQLRTIYRHALRRQKSHIEAQECDADRSKMPATPVTEGSAVQLESRLRKLIRSLPGFQPPTFTHTAWPGRSRGRRRPANLFSTSLLMIYCYLVLLVVVVPVSAVRIPFTNCLDEKYVASNPQKLQWAPLYANARFDTSTPKYSLEVVVWGNVTGRQDTTVQVPSFVSDPLYWSDSGKTNGKIIQSANPDAANPVATTLYRRINVLTYQPVNNRVDFCKQGLFNGACPLGPTFNTSNL